MRLECWLVGVRSRFARLHPDRSGPSLSQQVDRSSRGIAVPGQPLCPLAHLGNRGSPLGIVETHAKQKAGLTRVLVTPEATAFLEAGFNFSTPMIAKRLPRILVQECVFSSRAAIQSVLASQAIRSLCCDTGQTFQQKRRPPREHYNVSLEGCPK